MVASMTKSPDGTKIYSLANGKNTIKFEVSVIAYGEMIGYYIKNNMFDILFSLQKRFPEGFNCAIGMSWEFIRKDSSMSMKEFIKDIDKLIREVANEVNPDIFMYKAEDKRFHSIYEKLFNISERYELSYVTQSKDFLYYRRYE